MNRTDEITRSGFEYRLGFTYLIISKYIDSLRPFGIISFRSILIIT